VTIQYRESVIQTGQLFGHQNFISSMCKEYKITVTHLFINIP